MSDQTELAYTFCAGSKYPSVTDLELIREILNCFVSNFSVPWTCVSSLSL